MPPRRPTAGQLRLSKDLSELKEHPDVEVIFPNPQNLFEFHVLFFPSEGIWKSGKFVFSFKIPRNWPIDRPKVSLFTQIWHPNISTDGRLSLPMSYNYSPAISLSQLFAEVREIFIIEPNPSAPMNIEADEQYKKNIEAFKLKAQEYIDQFCPK